MRASAPSVVDKWPPRMRPPSAVRTSGKCGGGPTADNSTSMRRRQRLPIFLARWRPGCRSNHGGLFSCSGFYTRKQYSTTPPVQRAVQT